MVLGSISYSYTVVSFYATTQSATAPATPPAVTAPVPARPQAHGEEHEGHHGHGRHHHRGGRIAEAVRSALQEFFGTAPAAAPAAESVGGFSEALGAALKPPTAEPRRYGTLATRLDALATSLEQAPSAAGADEAAAPLVEAFSALLKTTQASPGDARTQLARFLHGIASALDARGSTAPTGQLIDATA